MKANFFLLLALLLFFIGVIFVIYKKNKRFSNLKDIDEIIDLDKEDTKIIKKAIEEGNKELLKEFLNSDVTSATNKKLIKEYLDL